MAAYTIGSGQRHRERGRGEETRPHKKKGNFVERHSVLHSIAPTPGATGDTNVGTARQDLILPQGKQNGGEDRGKGSQEWDRSTRSRAINSSTDNRLFFFLSALASLHIPLTL